MNNNNNNNDNNNNNLKFTLVYLEGADSIPKLDFQPKRNLTPVHSKPCKHFNFLRFCFQNFTSVGIVS